MKICYNCFHKLEDNARLCSNCGIGADISNAAQYPHALPCGSILAGRYVTGRVLGQGGFGITYVAQDYHTRELVAIKEYYPDTMAIRETSNSIVPYNLERSANFEYGKERFLEEARTLAEFIGSPHIVRVMSCFEENGTAYFVMEYVKGISLKKHLESSGGKISYTEAMRILTPVMEALSAVHEKGIIHRDVTPDNIALTEDGNVKLLDFGAARYSIGERSQSLDIILKHGFAPYEQYIHRSRQGPFTDIYSLAATLYYSITGVIPLEAVERLDQDTLLPPSALGTEIPRGAETALMKALAVRSDDRYRSMDEFKEAIEKSDYRIADGDRSNLIADPTGNGSSGSTSKDENGTAENDDRPERNQGQEKAPDNEKEAEKRQEQITEKAPSTELKQDNTRNLTTGSREIDLTGGSGRSKSDTARNASDEKKTIPGWVIPVIAAAVILILFLMSRKGTGTREGTGESASFAGTADRKEETISKEDRLNPEMKELLTRAENGDSAAQLELSINYSTGNGVDQDKEQARIWLIKSAEQGNADAQYQLAEALHGDDSASGNDETALEWYRKAAEAGHAQAQCQLAAMYLSGDRIDKDEKEAFTWYEKAAGQDFAEGQLGLGKLYLDGTGVKKDHKKAFEWIKKAADQGLAEAQYELGLLYRNGKGVDESATDAIAWFTKSANQGYAMAQYILGTCYEDGYGAAQDYEEAFAWYSKAADQGLAEAQNALGRLYQKGKGVAKDKEKAFAWYMKSAEQGLADAQVNVGQSYQYGNGVKQDSKEAVKWYRKAADQGDSYGQNNLGVMFAKGEGVDQDYEEALAWYTKAADQENSLAQMNIGYLYYDGRGVDQDYAQAMEWFKKAADLNNGDAAYAIGSMYLDGTGVQEDEDQAFEWFRQAAVNGSVGACKVLAYCLFNGVRYVQNYEGAFQFYMAAAEAGDAEAQYYIALMYEKGYGVEQDPEEARKWYELSAEQGYEEAVKRLEGGDSLEDLPEAQPDENFVPDGKKSDNEEEIILEEEWSPEY